jgi:hypothetical protein
MSASRDQATLCDTARKIEEGKEPERGGERPRGQQPRRLIKGYCDFGAPILAGYFGLSTSQQIIRWIVT